MHPRQRAEKLAADQHGVITGRQAESCDLTRHQVRQLVRSGRWNVLGHALFVIAGSRRTWHLRTITCVFAAGEAAAASHLAAAWLLNLIDKQPHRIDVTAPHGAHNGSAQGFVVHRSRTLPPSDIRRIDGIPVTCPARTLVDLAALLPDGSLSAALDTALLKGLVSIVSVRRFVVDRGLGRRKGVGVLLKLLDDREFGVPESELERRFLALVRKRKRPKPARQERIGPYRVDFLYEDARVVVEVDGRATHGTATAFEADPVRQNALVLDGWSVLRFTWKQITEQPGYVAETVLRAVTQAEG